MGNFMKRFDVLSCKVCDMNLTLQVKVWFQNRRMKWRHSKEGKVSSGTGESTAATPSASPVTSTTPSKVMDGALKDKKVLT